MTASARLPAPSAPDDTGAIFDAVADAMYVAGTYAATAIHFADIHDARGVAYATRCAAAAVATAAEMVAELRPQGQEGRRS